MERLTAEISRAFRDQQFESLEDANAALAARFDDVTLDDLPSTAATPLEQAQDLIYDAFEARGRRELQLIRRALALSPDCADAYVLLAERTSNLSEARSFYEQAVAAGRRGVAARGDAEGPVKSGLAVALRVLAPAAPLSQSLHAGRHPLESSRRDPRLQSTLRCRCGLVDE